MLKPAAASGQGAPRIEEAVRLSGDGTDWKGKRKKTKAILLAEYLYDAPEHIPYIHAVQVEVEVGVKPARLHRTFRLASELLDGWAVVTRKAAREQHGHMRIDPGKGHVLVRASLK